MDAVCKRPPAANSRFDLTVAVCSVFFFQAEDGIRDVAVTGVQTCALPISALRRIQACRGSDNSSRWRQTMRRGPGNSILLLPDLAHDRTDREWSDGGQTREIGRASCRERV